MATPHCSIPTINWTGTDLQDEWAKFQQHVELMFMGPMRKTVDDERLAYLLIWVGPEGRDIYNSWNLPEENKKYTFVLESFCKHCTPKKNSVFARYKFQQKVQALDEVFETFVTDLRNLVKPCKYHDPHEMVRDRIVAGINSTDIREKLLMEGDSLTMEKAIEIAVTFETTQQHLKSMAHRQNNTQINDAGNIDAVKRKTSRSKCRNCGLQHAPKNCPAFGTTCNYCSKPNHWQSVCSSKNRDRPRQREGMTSTFTNNRNVHQLKNDSSEEELELTLFGIETDQREEIMTNIKIADPTGKTYQMNAKIDTGANANILTFRCLKQMFPQISNPADIKMIPFVKESKTTLTGYGGQRISQFGTIKLKCGQEKFDYEFFIVDTNGPNIIGLQSSQQLKLVKINCSLKQIKQDIQSLTDLKEKYPDRFDTIGKFPGTVKITLHEDAQPVIQPPRKYPVNILDELKEELDRMESLQIIEKVTGPTDWVSSLAFSRKKDGSLRICLDPKHLNNAIKRPHHKIPTIEEISHKFHNAKVFSKMDAQSGYWALCLDEESSLLTTFNTPFGRMKFLRLPFGLKLSQDLFQLMMDQILEECPGTLGISDDICVYGADEEEHDRHLIGLMNISKKYGLVFNSSKCSIKKDRIGFYGMIWDKNGVHPDPQKCDDIKLRPSPQNAKELQQFIGLIQYMSPFIKNLSQQTEPLRKLLSKDSEWQWTESHEKAFQTLKDAIHESLTLRYYDPSKPTIIEVDSSIKGLGAALIQEGKPIAFASKSLSDAEKRYANIERELLSVVFGCERFHTYIYGKDIEILSDHKPLENISQKDISKAPPRLQRMLLRIQPYGCQIKYKPGKDMIFADFLSRHSPRHGDEIELDRMVHTINISHEKLEELRKETKHDQELSKICHFVTNGWPQSAKVLPKTIRKYWFLKDSFSMEDDVLLHGEAIVIPRKMQKEILDKIHEPHLGQEKSILRARNSVYWYGMSTDIKNKVQTCQICQSFSKTQNREPLMPHKIPERPFEKIATDIFELDGQKLLLVADYFSKMPFVKTLNTLTSKETIRHIKSIMAVHGIPNVLISDNGPQFTSEEFATFSKQWEFKHITSSPRFPQSNGFIERMVQIVKNCLKKSKAAGTDPQLALLALRNTPIDNQTPSPSEILFGRPVQDSLPSYNPERDINNKIKEQLMRRQQQQKTYYDRGTHNLPHLREHQQVNIQNTTTHLWTPATVIGPADTPRSYLVKTPDGKTLRRNRQQLKPRQSNNEDKLKTAEPRPSPHCTSHTPNKSTSSGSNQRNWSPADHVSSASTPKTQGPTITRSGRFSIPPNRFLDEI